MFCIVQFLQIAIKPSSLSKMKTIFTQEIFTEQVLTSHLAAGRVFLPAVMMAYCGYSQAFYEYGSII